MSRIAPFPLAESPRLVPIEPRAYQVPAPRPATLRDMPCVAPSPLAAKSQDYVRAAYDAVMSAGALIMTMQGTASADDRPTLEALRRTLRDCACDLSVAAYRLPMQSK
jgi:hypothetical protein